MNVKTVTNQFWFMYIQYTVSCIKHKHVLKSKSTKARGVEGGSKTYFPVLRDRRGFKNSNCLKMGAIEKILPPDVSP